jgi:hypothetical protein
MYMPPRAQLALASLINLYVSRLTWVASSPGVNRLLAFKHKIPKPSAEAQSPLFRMSRDALRISFKSDTRSAGEAHRAILRERPKAYIQYWRPSILYERNRAAQRAAGVQGVTRVTAR